MASALALLTELKELSLHLGENRIGPRLGGRSARTTKKSKPESCSCMAYHCAH